MLARRAERHRRFLHVSTDEVYGSLGPTGRFTETTPYAPHSPYSASKAATDHLVRAYHHTYGLPVTVTNCSNNYGPYQFPEKLIPLMILNALEGKPLPVYGDGQQRPRLAVRRRPLPGHNDLSLYTTDGSAICYNIGGGEELPNLTVIDTLCSTIDQAFANSPSLLGRFPDAPAAHGIPTEILKTYVADRPGHDRRYAIDETKIRTELGYAPALCSAERFATTLQWYLDNGSWWQAIMDGSYRSWVDANYAGRPKIT